MESSGLSADEWLASYAQRLGTPAPSGDELELILALAGVAAHASERIAAPAACWVAANADVPLEHALAIAREVS